MDKLAIILVAIFFLVACERDPVSRNRTDNPEIVVEKLFTQDGCTVYRFSDVRSHYFTKCVAEDGKISASTSSTHSCGKNCTRTEQIKTN